MKSGKRLLALFFFGAAAVLIGSMVFAYRVGLLLPQAEANTQAQLMVLRQLEDFLSVLKDTETGQRGYLLTGEEKYLEPYRRGLFQVEGRLVELQRLATRGDLARAQVDPLIALTRRKLVELAETIQLRRDKGLAAALAIVREDRGREDMERIRGEVARMEDEQEAKLTAAARRVHRAGAAQTAAFVIAGCVNLAFLIWMFGKISGEMRRREEAVLAESREKELLNTTLASIGDGVIVTDAEGRVTFSNPEAERLTGWKSSEALGRKLGDVFRIVNEDTRQPAENPVDKVLRLGSVVGLANHTILIGKQGVETPIDDSAAPVRSSGGPLFGVVLVFRDFTAQRKAEEVRARLSAIIDSSGDAIVSKNLDGVIQTWNGGAQRIFGYRPEEIIGKPVTVLIPEGHIGEEQEILARIRSGQLFEQLDTVRVAKDGRRIPVALSVSPIKDREGRIIGASKILHDITQRKRVEQELREAHEQLASHALGLEKAVEERTAKLREMIGELEHVSYAIVHDMRAPLRAMQAFSQMLASESPDEGPEERAEYAHRIMGAASRLDKLIQDALNYNKAVLRDMPPEAVDLAKLLRGLVETYPNLDSSQADIRLEGALPVVLGNEALLTECFSNLLGNAVKFVPPGTRPKVVVRAESANGFSRIWVEDNGIGIPRQGRERMFGLFQRLTHDYEGTGIGLAIVRKVVERMKGRLGYESEPGQGSRFWVELPIAPEESPG